MNVRSKYDTDEPQTRQRARYMREGCGAPYSMIAQPTRVDVSTLRASKFIRKIFRLMGWKTEAEDIEKSS